MKKKIFSYILPIIISIIFFEVVISPVILNNNSDNSAYNIKRVINSPNSVPIQQSSPLVYEKSIGSVSLIYPNIINYIDDIPILLYDGDFKINDRKSNGYFYPDFPIIVLDKNGDNIETTLTHELLHYIDYLKGDSNFWSIDNISIENIIDTNIVNLKEKSFDKLFFLVTQGRDIKDSIFQTKKLQNEANFKWLSNFINMELLNYHSNLNYYISPQEMFVRINLLKLKMYEKGIIERDDLKELTKGISKENIEKFIRFNLYDEINADYYITMYFINYNK